jgi:hypothetical protein
MVFSPRPVISIVALLAVTALATSAAAQTGAKSAAAQGLFDEAKALMAAGRATEACPKLEESQRLDPGSGTLINLALCYEQTGRIASAWTTYRDAAAAARSAGNAKRERGARERAEVLAPKVSRLTLEVPKEARLAGLVVVRNGTEVGEAEWGVAIPTDEGTHEVVVKAPEYLEWRGSVQVKGTGTTATLTIPKLERAPSRPNAAPGASATTAAPSVATGPASAGDVDQGSGLGAQRIAAIGLGAVGVAGVAVGAIFGVKASSKKSEADETCAGNSCTSDAGVQAGNDAYTAGNVSTIAFIAGGAALAGGVVLWFTAPSRRATTELSLSTRGVQLRGSF